MSPNRVHEVRTAAYLHGLGDGAAFVTPLFVDENAKFWIQSLDSETDDNTSFTRYTLSGTLLPECEPVTRVAGGERLFAFYSGEGPVLRGTKSELRTALKERLREFESRPFLYRELLAFLGEPVPRHVIFSEALKLARSNAVVGAKWLSSVEGVTSADIDKLYKDAAAHPLPPEKLNEESRFTIESIHERESIGSLLVERMRGLRDSLKTQVGSATSSLQKGFVTINVLIGPRNSSAEIAACNIFASDLPNFEWEVLDIPPHSAIRPNALVYLQEPARELFMPAVFRSVVVSGVTSGVLRTLDDASQRLHEGGNDFYIILAAKFHLGMTTSKVYRQYESVRFSQEGLQVSFDLDEHMRRSSAFNLVDALPSVNVTLSVETLKPPVKYQDLVRAFHESLQADETLEAKCAEAAYAAISNALKASPSPFSPPGLRLDKYGSQIGQH